MWTIHNQFLFQTVKSFVNPAKAIKLTPEFLKYENTKNTSGSPGKNGRARSDSISKICHLQGKEKPFTVFRFTV